MIFLIFFWDEALGQQWECPIRAFVVVGILEIAQKATARPTAVYITVDRVAAGCRIKVR